MERPTRDFLALARVSVMSRSIENGVIKSRHWLFALLLGVALSQSSPGQERFDQADAGADRSSAVAELRTEVDHWRNLYLEMQAKYESAFEIAAQQPGYGGSQALIEQIAELRAELEKRDRLIELLEEKISRLENNG
jgi:hypothetical protein